MTELVDAVRAAVWDGEGENSFRRNLQREHVERLIDLALLRDDQSPSLRTIGTLARQQLRQIRETVAGAGGGDAYTAAHRADLAERIERALEADVVLAR